MASHYDLVYSVNPWSHSNSLTPSHHLVSCVVDELGRRLRAHSDLHLERRRMATHSSAPRKVKLHGETDLVTPDDHTISGCTGTPSAPTGIAMSKTARMPASVQKSDAYATAWPGHTRRPNPNAKLALSGAFSGGRKRSGRKASGSGYRAGSCSAALCARAATGGQTGQKRDLEGWGK